MENSQEKKLYIADAMRNLLSELADYKYYCEVELPNFRTVKAKIIEVNFTNIEWLPVKVKFLEKLNIEETFFEDNEFSEGQHPVKKQVRYYEDWISVLWIKNCAYF